MNAIDRRNDLKTLLKDDRDALPKKEPINIIDKKRGSSD
jgi:hypothetical protein